ncbi:hypothetical protein ACFOLJ_27570 [Rugamonas sp. CCM 8940]|uniref:hypothetical protein n=1 Tax=Rugamonas sp. CCM 8940 TaxID=2765359 RepID=UPI0018F4FA99|nr:hypothetical protein [Rugamonas sp. CCM 8940]MBJ7311231.1 hypothetical protein [Rugamonas sp. CCM 8940]
MMLRLIAACAALACADAAASGGGDNYDRFVNRGASDIAPTRYQNGELGVLLPSFERMYLYSAWRAIALGPQELKTLPNRAGGLERSLGSKVGGWLDAGQGSKIYAAWQGAVAAALKRAPAPKKDNDMLASGYLNCPSGAYVFATGTLGELAKRADATPARLAAWVASQRQVFKFCGDDPDATQRGYGDAKVVVTPPLELPATEALYWRQMQQYQLAAAAFYDGNYIVSAQRFGQIGATADHPLRQWGDYLNLRSLARAASQAASQANNQAAEQNQGAARTVKVGASTLQEDRLTAISVAAQKIQRDPALASLHEASRAIVRAMQVRLTPEARFAQLSKLLDDPRADPYLDDHLGDWRVLADDRLSDWTSKEKQAASQQLRAVTGFMDWIQTLQQCGAPHNSDGDSDGAAAKAADSGCAPQRAHALQQWRKHGGDAGQTRVWLVAAALKAGQMPADLEQAALKVPAGAPEYLTVRYALARHYRLKGQAEPARAIGDAMLASPALSASASSDARNLFLQERFAVASSPADAANYLLRSVSRSADADTGESARVAEAPQVAADGLRWLNGGLSTAELLALASHPKLDAGLRASIAVAAWMRADLLGQGELALQAAQLAQAAPALADAMRQYRALPAAPARRHAMVLSALQYGLSPVVNGSRIEAGSTPRDKAETLADLWCKIPRGAAGWGEPDTAVELSPPAPETGRAESRKQEMAALGALPTSTGFIGAHVLQRVAAVPADPDLPWLLHVVVQSTRGGCLDTDAKALSKNAFNLLHKRYKGDEWARKTPYFY